jgi:Domain of unknown function DUF11
MDGEDVAMTEGSRHKGWAYVRGEREGDIVIRARVRRLVATVSIGSLLVIQAFAGSAAAAPPKWVMSVDKLPAAVTPGGDAGYRVTITNNGPSNISQLYLVTDSTATPVYLTSSRSGTCNELGALTGPLSCAFGALNAGVSVVVTVAYSTVGTSGNAFEIKFQANTTGNTFSDSKGRSHGDQLTTAVSTALNANKNFAGTFSPSDGGTIANDAQLTGNNKQATGVIGIPAGFEATVEDGPGTTGTCTSDGPIPCNALFGEWSVVTVGEGATFDDYFIVTIKFKTGTPTGFLHSYVDPANPGATVQEAIGPCAGGVPAASVPCFTWDDATDTASIYTFHNGSFKGR